MERDYVKDPLTLVELEKAVEKFFRVKVPEHITQKVNYLQRFEILVEVESKDYSFSTIQAYLAEQIEMAYVAGANSLDVNCIPSKGVRDTGQVIVLARNYVRDKGYRK